MSTQHYIFEFMHHENFCFDVLDMVFESGLYRDVDYHDALDMMVMMGNV